MKTKLKLVVLYYIDFSVFKLIVRFTWSTTSTEIIHIPFQCIQHDNIIKSINYKIIQSCNIIVITLGVFNPLLDDKENIYRPSPSRRLVQILEDTLKQRVSCGKVSREHQLRIFLSVKKPKEPLSKLSEKWENISNYRGIISRVMLIISLLRFVQEK